MIDVECLGVGSIDENDLKNITFIQYKNMRIYLNIDQEFLLSESKKTIYIVQYDNNKKIIGKKGFRVSACAFYLEIEG